MNEEEEIEGFRSRMQDLLDRFENNNNPTQQEVLEFLVELNLYNYNKPDIVQEILNIRERSTGNSILHYAVRQGYQIVIDKLLNELGINPSIPNDYDRTPVNLTESQTFRLLRDTYEDLNKKGGDKKNRSKKKISRKRRKNKRNKRRTFRYFL